MFWKKQRVYLDAAAGIAANPFSPHTEGREARAVLEAARVKIARLAEVQADDVVFTSGATESNALAILGVVRAQRSQGKRLHALYLPTAHASVVENMKLLEQEGVLVEPLPIRDYRVDTIALTTMLTEATVLISMDAVCGETGVVWNTREVANVVRKARAATEERILLHVDASQAPLTQKITRDHFAADLVSFDASKVGAVRGIGALVAHRTIMIEPLYRGGGQERGVRSGTESPELVARFAESLERAVRNREAFLARVAAEREQLKAHVSHIPNVYVQEGPFQAPHILNLSLPGRDTDYLVALLDEAGFAVATRSACETDSETGSRAVFALTGDLARAKATLRVSWGGSASSSELRRFARALAESVAFIDSRAHG